MPKPQIQKHGIEGDVAVGLARDQHGNLLHVIKVGTQRMETVIVLTTAERDNLVRALTEEMKEDPTAAARAAIWTPPSESG